MTYVDKPVQRPQHANQVCNVCGKPNADTICEVCANHIRAEAVDHKKHEEKPHS